MIIKGNKNDYDKWNQETTKENGDIEIRHYEIVQEFLGEEIVKVDIFLNGVEQKEDGFYWLRGYSQVYNKDIKYLRSVIKTIVGLKDIIKEKNIQIKKLQGTIDDIHLHRMYLNRL